MPDSEIILHITLSGDRKVEVILQNKTVWLTRKAIGKLFGVETDTINYHLKENNKIAAIHELPKDNKGGFYGSLHFNC